VDGWLVRATAAASDIDAVRSRTRRHSGRACAHEIEEHVVVLGLLGKVFAGIIDDIVRADGPDEFDVPGATDGGHAGAKGFGNLHSKCSHAAGCA